MSSSTSNSIGSVITIGTIIAIVVGSVLGLATLIGTCIVILCIVKHLNRSKTIPRQGMILQQSQPYPNSLSNQYPPNTMSVANYPSIYQSTAPPYTASAQN